MQGDGQPPPASGGHQHHILLLDSLFSQSRHNAVSSQIWIAITIYLLIAIVKESLLNARLYQILQVPRVPIFDHTPILQAFQPQNNQDDLSPFSNQLKRGLLTPGDRSIRLP